MLRTHTHSVAFVILGCLSASVARAEDAAAKNELAKPAAGAAATKVSAPATPAAKPSTSKVASKPAPGAKAAPTDKAAPTAAPTDKAAPAAKPAPAKPKAAATPKAAPAPSGATQPASDFEQRWHALEGALYRAGLLEAPPVDEAKKQAIDAELAKLEAQQKSLDAAVQGGLDPQAIKPTLVALQKRRDELLAERSALGVTDSGPAGAAKPPLVTRLDALEASVKGLEARAGAAAPPAAPTAAAPATPKPAPEAAPTAPITAGYDDGFVLRSADGKFKLQPNGFLQVRFTQEWLERAPDRTAFSLPRARAGMKGNLFTKDFKYNFLVDFGKGKYELDYYYLDYTVVDHYLAVRAGVQKRPFSRAFLNASEKQELVSSTATGKAFGDSHDLGVELHNGTPAFEYAIGIFNGNGSKGTFTGDVKTDPAKGTGKVTGGDFNNVPDRFHPALVARAAYNYGEIQGYSEADLEGGPLRFSAGVAGMSDLDYDNDNTSYLRGTADAVVKVEGFSAQAGGYVSSKEVGKAYADRAYEAAGLLLESGFVIAKQFQPVVRWDWVKPAKPAFDTHELSVGFSVYFHKHALKWQNELETRFTRVKDGPRKDFALLSQAQFIF